MFRIISDPSIVYHIIVMSSPTNSSRTTSNNITSCNVMWRRITSPCIAWCYPSLSHLTLLSCAAAVGRLSYGFLWGPVFNTLCHNFAGISSDFQQIHYNFSGFSPDSPEIHQNSAKTSNWSTSKKGITTTRPSHSHDIYHLPSTIYNLPSTIHLLQSSRLKCQELRQETRTRALYACSQLWLE